MATTRTQFDEMRPMTRTEVRTFLAEVFDVIFERDEEELAEQQQQSPAAAAALSQQPAQQQPSAELLQQWQQHILSSPHPWVEELQQPHPLSLLIQQQQQPQEENSQQHSPPMWQQQQQQYDDSPQQLNGSTSLTPPLSAPWQQELMATPASPTYCLESTPEEDHLLSTPVTRAWMRDLDEWRVANRNRGTATHHEEPLKAPETPAWMIASEKSMEQDVNPTQPENTTT